MKNFTKEAGNLGKMARDFGDGIMRGDVAAPAPHHAQRPHQRGFLLEGTLRFFPGIWRRRTCRIMTELDAFSKDLHAMYLPAVQTQKAGPDATWGLHSNNNQRLIALLQYQA